MPDKKKSVITNASKPLVKVKDEEIDLGHQLSEADALNWGRDVNQLKKLEHDAKQLPAAEKSS